uniref:uncharacterized protein LOC101311950 isoform X1 n=1 Tax=Fragaria vesca subsp. vesca TaxID=101020 RepID=UPI0005CAF3ED|nr:PREDICTED: uncharacterized protein LOC101311950 isoform X1 [Fragaria vesca subsp. vesca]
MKQDGHPRNPQAAQILTQTLNPIPFVPAKSLHMQPHQEDLLKRLGLWDFLHIHFDPCFRTDLIAELVANYSPQARCSFVADVRVSVSRADLGRALKLPVKKQNKNVAREESKESIGLVEDLVGNWVLLGEDEMWEMPEVMEWYKDIVEGQFGNVDWAGLIWCMVEKELLKGEQLGDCYYASLLQLLIKSQCEGLFSVEEQGAAEVEEESGKMDDFQGGRLEEHGIGLCLDVEHFEGEDVEKVDVEGEDVEKVDVEGENVEKYNIELENVEEKVDSEQETVEEKVDIELENVEEKVDFEQGNVEKFNIEQETMEDLDVELENVDSVDIELENVEKVDVDQENGEKVTGVKVLVDLGDEYIMDTEEYKEEKPNHWLSAGKENFREPCLRRCNLDRVRDLGCGSERKNYMKLGEEEDDDYEEEKEDDREGGIDLPLKGFSLEGLSSGRLMHVTEGGNIPPSSGMPLHDHLATDFPSSRWDLMLPGRSSLSGNGHKREFSQENDNSHHGLNSNKRLRTDDPWHSKMPGDFDMCMEHVQQWMEKTKDIQQWMGKARMMYVAKEQEYEDAKMNPQLLLVELQKKDELIEHLHKARTAEQQKRHTEKHRFEYEVHLMQNLLNGYRQAIKATQKAFAEYRAHTLQADEPLDRDVHGSGGLVLSAGELKKLRLKQEEEERMKHLAIETKIKGFEAGWISKFEGHHKSVEIVSNRLLDVEKGVKLLNEQLTERRLAETAEPTPNES